ncbi:hypothetical protein B5M47_03215 [candidate division CPR3 bacterium 4484_211]|uniref:SH3b domain-containing protein n=1 Tax=candidate division CPR3 bacterium 4484_211 TaxID=1968527 RepID=A0A1W9NXA6_UNCC3|nr:MAG: hypothetical protein B5M47_03215 [candidate division CPR3 bacterium 4484_211]
MKRLLVLITLFIFAALAAIFLLFLLSRQSGGEVGGSLEVVSLVEGRQVFVEGVLQGETPWTKEGMAGGFYLVRVADKEGLLPGWEGKVRIVDGEKSRIRVSLSARHFSSVGILSFQKSDQGQGRIAITSTPSESTVFLDGQEKGVSPIVLSGVEEGLHEVKLAREGWKSWQMNIDLRRDERAVLDVEMGLFPFFKLQEVSGELPAGQPALSLEAVKKRDSWSLAESACDEAACPRKEWANLKLYSVELADPRADVADWLKGVQLYARNILNFPEFPFAYVVDPLGNVYQGSATRNLDYSLWNFSLIEGFVANLNAGDYVVVVVLPSGGEVSSDILARVAQIKEMVKPTQSVKVLATIKETPTGFLNVRSGPSLNASIIGKVFPGAQYEFLEESPGWYRIKLDETTSGWVYSRYVEKG